MVLGIQIFSIFMIGIFKKTLEVMELMYYIQNLVSLKGF